MLVVASAPGIVPGQILTSSWVMNLNCYIPFPVLCEKRGVINEDPIGIKLDSDELEGAYFFSLKTDLPAKMYNKPH